MDCAPDRDCPGERGDGLGHTLPFERDSVERLIGRTVRKLGKYLAAGVSPRRRALPAPIADGGNSPSSS